MFLYKLLGGLHGMPNSVLMQKIEVSSDFCFEQIRANEIFLLLC